MNTKEIVVYLKHVLETEKHLYTLTCAMYEIEDKLDQLGHATRYQKPELEFLKSIRQTIMDMLGVFFGVGLIGFTVGLFAGAIYWFISGYPFFFALVFRVAFTLAFIGGGIAALITLLVNISNNNKIKQNNEDAQKKYFNAIAQDNIRVSKEEALKEEIINYNCAVYAQIRDTQDVLSTLYDLDIIHKHYREIIPVASFYQYFDTGRCSSFDGPDGAYNLYEAELRQNMIINQLDKVIERLDAIKNTQKALYYALQEANHRLENLTHISELSLSYGKANANNSEIIAYNTHVTAENTNALMWINAIDVVLD